MHHKLLNLDMENSIDSHASLLFFKTNFFFNVKIYDLILLPEFFLSSNSVILIIYCSLIAYNKSHSYNLIQISVFSLCILIILSTLFLILNDGLNHVKYLSYDSFFLNNFLTIFAKLVTIIISLLCIYLIQDYVLNNQINNIEYSLLCTYSLIGLIIILAANDFATIFLALELQSLSFYILSGFKKDTIFSVENGLKYFLLGSLSSSYFLLGWNLLYGFSGLSLISNFHILFFDMILPNVMKNNDMESIKKLTKKTNSNITLKDFKTSILTGIGQTSNKIITKLDQITVNLKTAYNLTINNNNYLYDNKTFAQILLLINNNKCESLLTNLNKTESIKFSYYNYNAYIIKENFKETSNSYYESTLFSINSINKKKIFEYSLLLILISFFFKLAVAPFHSWSIDVYEGSPTSSTIFFATVTKISLFIVLIKIFYYGFYHFLKSFLYQFLINTSMLSVFLGSLTGITERKLKSLLAYSAINNTGYLLLAISIGTINGIKATIFYLIIYTSSSLAAWSGLISIKIIKNRHLKKESKDLSDIVMLRKTNPMLTALLILILFSSAGLPPFVGFVIKLEIFLTSIESSIFLISILIIITSILSTFYYLRIVKVICFEKILVGKLYKTLKLKQSLINCGISFFLVYQFLKPWFSILFSYKASVC